MSSIIQTPTNNLQGSLSFYSKLDFTILSENNPTLVSDGSVVIEINPDRFARAGVKLYRESWTDVVNSLKEKDTIILDQENGYLMADPSGTWVYLEEGNIEIDLENVKSSTLGVYAGVSLETMDMKGSIELWEELGFSHDSGGVEKGWVAYKNVDGMTVSFMKPNICPHLFFNPSLTYFNGKNNIGIIEEIRKSGVAITEEITTFNKEGIVDNIIIRDPGGYGFFIFSD